MSHGHFQAEQLPPPDPSSLACSRILLTLGCHPFVQSKDSHHLALKLIQCCSSVHLDLNAVNIHIVSMLPWQPDHKPITKHLLLYDLINGCKLEQGVSIRVYHVLMASKDLGSQIYY